MGIHQIALLIPGTYEDIDCKQDSKTEMAGRHVGSYPEEYQEPKHKWVPYVFVESPQLERNLLGLGAPEIMPYLLKPQQFEVIDHEA